MIIISGTFHRLRALLKLVGDLNNVRALSNFWILALAVVLISGPAMAITDPVSDSLLSRGHQILLQRGLQIQAWSIGTSYGFDWNTWKQSNLSGVNWTSGLTAPNWVATMEAPETPTNVLWSRRDGEPPGAISINGLVTGELPYAANMVHYGFKDEQNMDSSTNRAEAATWLAARRADLPHVIGFTNQYGWQTSNSTMLTYMAQAQPDMLSFDTYPLGLHGGGVGRNEYYRDLLKYRALAMAGNNGTGDKPIPFNVYLDLVGSGANSPALMRWNQMAAWTFGAKSAIGFVYNSSSMQSVLFDASEPFYSVPAFPTAAFYAFAETNRQSRNLGKSLVRLISTDVRDNGNVSGYIANWDASADPDGYMTAVTGDAVIGYFKPLSEDFDGPAYTNETYFMVLNHQASGSLASSAQMIRLDFDFGNSGITSLQRLNRLTGLVEEVALASDGDSLYHLDVYLEGGTADLFKFNTGATFVVPEPATLVLLAVGGCLTLRRRRSKSDGGKLDHVRKHTDSVS